MELSIEDILAMLRRGLESGDEETRSQTIDLCLGLIKDYLELKRFVDAVSRLSQERLQILLKLAEQVLGSHKAQMLESQLEEYEYHR